MGTAAPVLLFLAAVGLGLAAARELLAGRGSGRDQGAGTEKASGASRQSRFVLASALIVRLGLEARLARSGLGDRITLQALVAAKLAGAMVGLLVGAVASPAAPGRVALLVALGMPVAGFLGPDAWLERRARARLRALRAALPDALDLLAVGTAAGRSPSAGMAELGTGEGPLASELAILAAEESCGAPQRELLQSLRRRVPISEVAGMCGAIDRSRRFGSPLAEQLSEQANSLRASQSRRIEEHAARAAPEDPARRRAAARSLRLADDRRGPAREHGPVPGGAVSKAGWGGRGGRGSRVGAFCFAMREKGAKSEG